VKDAAEGSSTRPSSESLAGQQPPALKDPEEQPPATSKSPDEQPQPQRQKTIIRKKHCKFFQDCSHQNWIFSINYIKSFVVN